MNGRMGMVTMQEQASAGDFDVSGATAPWDRRCRSAQALPATDQRYWRI
jgi:hypothetical protein